FDCQVLRQKPAAAVGNHIERPLEGETCSQPFEQRICVELRVLRKRGVIKADDLLILIRGGPVHVREPWPGSTTLRLNQSRKGLLRGGERSMDQKERLRITPNVVSINRF